MTFTSRIAACSLLIAVVCTVGCRKTDHQASPKKIPPAPHYRFGEVVHFGRGGKSSTYKRAGWGDTEAQMTWSNGTSAKLAFVLPESREPLRLRMKLSGFTNLPTLLFQPVDVVINDESVAQWQVSDSADFVAIIPSEVASHEELLVELRIPEAISPKVLGLSDDSRMLGVACYDLDITEANSPQAVKAAEEWTKALAHTQGRSYELGSVIKFGLGAGAQRFKLYGWYPPEKDFTWTGGLPAAMEVSVGVTEHPLLLKLRAEGLVAPNKLTVQPTEVYVNRHKIAQWQVGPAADYVAKIPAELTQKDDNLKIEFHPMMATSPQELGIGPDRRILGIRCDTLTIVQDDTAPVEPSPP